MWSKLFNRLIGELKSSDTFDITISWRLEKTWHKSTTANNQIRWTTWKLKLPRYYICFAASISFIVVVAVVVFALEWAAQISELMRNHMEFRTHYCKSTHINFIILMSVVAFYECKWFLFRFSRNKTKNNIISSKQHTHTQS